MLAVPIYMLQLFDRVVATGSIDTLVVLTAMVVFPVSVLAALDGVRGAILNRLGSWVGDSLGAPILSASIAVANAQGGTGAPAPRDLATVRSFLTGTGVFPLLDSPWVPAFIAIIYLMHPWLGSVSLAGALLLFGFALLNERLTSKGVSRASAAAGSALSAADRLVENADVIQAMGMRRPIVSRWQESSRQANALMGSAGHRAQVIAACAKFTHLFLQISVLGLGAFLALKQEITPGTTIAASIIMGRALGPVEQSIQGWKGFLQARGAYARLSALLSTAPFDQDYTRLPKPAGDLALHGVTFVQPGSEQPVVRQVSLECGAGLVMAIIGPSGAGKTSLSRLIVGSLEPTVGSIRFGGREVSAWPADDRGRYVGYLPQAIELFDGTVRENIARFQEAADEIVVRAARLAGAHEMILGLPDAYETRIGRDGIRLSGGQGQLVGLARAVFGDPSLVVLDEPNSNLDGQGVKSLITAIRMLKRNGVTVVLITHRASLLREADRIIAMANGRIADDAAAAGLVPAQAANSKPFRFGQTQAGKGRLSKPRSQAPKGGANDRDFTQA